MKGLCYEIHVQLLVNPKPLTEKWQQHLRKDRIKLSVNKQRRGVSISTDETSQPSCSDKLATFFGLKEATTFNSVVNKKYIMKPK